MIILALLVAAGFFTLYAVYTQYQKTPLDQSVPKRVWASVVAAAAAAGAAIVAWVHSATAPPL